MNVDDRFAILDLISSYSYSWDNNDVETFLSLWVDEPHIGEIGDQPRKQSEYGKTNKKALKETFERIHQMHQLGDEEGSQPRHLQTNTLLREVSKGRVVGTTMYTVLSQYRGEPVPRLVSCGLYEDEFVFTGDSWKFNSRKIIPDHD